MVSTSSPLSTLTRTLGRLRPSLVAWAFAAALTGGCTDSERSDSHGSAPTSPNGQVDRAATDKDKDKAALPAAEGLLAESVEAQGGADRIKAIRSYHLVSSIEIAGQGIAGRSHTWWRDGDFFVETDIPGVGKLRQGSQGGKVWNDDPINGPRTITGIEAEQFAWSSSRNLALDWKKYFKSAETTEIAEIAGTQVAVIKFISEGGDEVILRLDMATKLPHSQSFKQANPLGAMPVTVTFADFRDVAGTKVAFKQIIDATLTQMTSVNEEFEVNVEIKDELFAPPGPKAIKLPGEAAEAPPPAPAEPAADPKAAQK